MLAKLNKADKGKLIDRYGNLLSVLSIAKDRLIGDCGSYTDLHALRDSAYNLYNYAVELEKELLRRAGLSKEEVGNEIS